MSNLNTLIVTNHLQLDDPFSSTYSLSHAMSARRTTGKFVVASLGFGKNGHIYDCSNSQFIYGKEINSGFSIENINTWFEDSIRYEIDEFNIAVFRLDRPVSDDFLKWAAKTFQKQITINNPLGIMTTGSKRFLLNFPKLSPVIGICKTMDDVAKASLNGAIVLKPLDNFGGQGIIRIDIETTWLESKKIPKNNAHLIVSSHLEKEKEMLAMHFLKGVTKGDKRVIVINGKIIASTLRVPKPGSWIATMKQGAKSVFTEADEDERQIVSAIDPLMQKHGVVAYGIDTLLGNEGRRVLSEINTLNVGGFIQAEENTGLPVSANAAALMWQYIESIDRNI